MYAPYAVSCYINVISALAERRLHPVPGTQRTAPPCAYDICISPPQMTSPVVKLPLSSFHHIQAFQKQRGAAPGLTCETRTARRMLKKGEKHPAKKKLSILRITFLQKKKDAGCSYKSTANDVEQGGTHAAGGRKG